ncbi:MAG: CtsR family transcriptional regulator [Ignavibacteriales bacterium]
MNNLTDRIEKYLKVLIDRSGTNEIEIQRIELAETFNCVPSQITYVLATRFTMQTGFITESKRGGKGFVKIRRLPERHGVGWSGISQSQAERMIADLLGQELMTAREAEILLTVCNREVLGMTAEERDYVRARILGSIFRLMEGWKNEL